MINRTIKNAGTKNNFTVIDNKAIRDKNLSLGARGLLHQILSNKNEYCISETKLVYQTGEKITKIRTYIKELLQTGHMIRERKQKRGSYNYYEYTINEIPYGYIPNVWESNKQK
jgi:hypothetical protein